MSAKSSVPDPSKNATKYISYEEVQKHKTRDSCWVIIEGQVYDATPILDTHPGGSAVILKNSGKDATKSFKPIHPPDTLSSLPSECFLGPIDPATVPKAATEPTEEEKRIAKVRETLPPPAAAINLYDIEELAQKVLTNTAWAYYRSSGDDESTYYENRAAFKRFWFRPRVLNKVSHCSLETHMLGVPCALPIHISPAALARLGHPDGEMNLTRAAGKGRILQGVSSNASCSMEEIVSAKLPGQELIFQLYVNRDRVAGAAHIRKVDKMGFKAIMLTVDAAVPGKRELDQRVKGEFTGPSGTGKTGTGLGVALTISGYQDPDVCWADIDWIRSLTELPLIIKGIQCVEDAVKAFEYGVQGIVVSNHGGRELDFSPAPMTVLYEIYQQKPDLLRRDDFEVYLDGGVARGTDVVKALCLGARSVGLGRPFLYGNGVWGEEGCIRVIEIMQDEIRTCMQLMGVTSISQLGPNLIRYVDRDPAIRARL